MKNFAKIFIFIIFSLCFFSGTNFLKATKQVGPYDSTRSGQSFHGIIRKKPSERSKLLQEEKIIEQYLSAAKKGDAVAQFNLGCIYQFGFVANSFLNTTVNIDDRCIVRNIQKNLDIDYTKAFHWFKVAADQNYVPAKAHLAFFYLRGLNVVTIDIEKAILLFREAAAAKYIPAINALGDIFYNGKYMPKDTRQAFEFYNTAAKANFAPALFNVAKMYESGEAPANKNIPLALSMYENAALGRSEKAMYRLAQIYETGEYGKAIDLCKSYHFYLQAAQLNHAPAIFEVAQMYHYGNAIVAKDEKVALSLYKKAADLNHAPSALIVGNAHSTGKMGAEVDPTISRTCYEKAMATSEPEAKLELAQMLVHKVVDIPDGVSLGMRLAETLTSDSSVVALAENLIGKVYEYGCSEEKIKRDIPKAIRIYKSAAAKKNVFAQYALGRIYQYGDESSGLSPNISLSVSYYCDAARNGYAVAQNTLGLIYWNGTLVKKNLPKAIQYLKLAADQDFAEAQSNLGYIYISVYPEDTQLKRDAVRLIQRATEQNSDAAWFNLGYMYQNGIGLEKNFVQAKRCFERAAMQNNSQAIEALKNFDADVLKELLPH